MSDIDYDLGKHQLGETIVITGNVTATSTGAAADPSAVAIYIRLPDMSVGVNGTAMTKDDTGEYHYNYTISGASTGQLGKYSGKIAATGAGGLISINTFEFEAIKSF